MSTRAREVESNQRSAIVAEQVVFPGRQEFGEWLHRNHSTSKGVRLFFSKTNEVKTLKPGEALEEALCFGWIDGQIKSLGDKAYLKKFTPRTKGSKWSAVNKALAGKLIERGSMTEHEMSAIEEAKTGGGWDVPGREPASEDQVKALTESLQGADRALANFLQMPASVKRTYAAFYLDAKKEETKIKRLANIIERLNANKRPT